MVAGAFALGAVSLILLGITGVVARIVFGQSFLGSVWLFDLGSDNAIPTWYSSILLLLCAAALAALAVTQRRKRDHDAWRWAGLAVIFAVLSVDEVAMIHEWSANLIQRNMTGFFYFRWVIVGLLFVAAVGVAYLPFVLRLPPRTRWLVAASGAIFVGGAVGMEMVNANLAHSMPERELTYALMTALEEALEKAGAILFLYALLDLLARSRTRVFVTFDEARGLGVKPAHAESSLA